MAGLTNTEWVATTVNGHLVLKTTLTQTSTTIYDGWTKKTPKQLDTTKSFIVVVNTAGTTLDGSSLPVDLWIGYDEDAALENNSGTDVTATSTVEIASAIMDDVKAEKLASRIDPHYTGTRIQAATDTAGMINGSKPPYFILNLDGTTVLAAEDCLIVITQ